VARWGLVVVATRLLVAGEMQLRETAAVATGAADFTTYNLRKSGMLY